MTIQKEACPQVSVAVLTYNPQKEKLFQTIKSIIEQKYIELDLVIADDGSTNTYFEEVEVLFQSSNFTNYRFVRNQINQGTVKNCLSAVKACEGKYVKLLSPGDFLYADTVLYRWVNFLEKNIADWSFSEAFYYRMDGSNICLTEQYAHPQDIKPYIKKNDYKCRWNYIVNGDLCLGAATICKKDIMLKYLNMIQDKVKYAEDNIYRIMMMDGLNVEYFQEKTIMYEFGDGVSTSGSMEWVRRLRRDRANTTQIMMEQCDRSNPFEKRLYKAFLVERMEYGYVRKFRRFFMRGCLWYNIKNKFKIKIRKTVVSFNESLNS